MDTRGTACRAASLALACSVRFSCVIITPVLLHLTEKGLFSQCLGKMVTGGIAKPYLVSFIGGEVGVRLNDGRCSVQESDTMFYFHTSRKASECGTQRRVSA